MYFIYFIYVYILYIYIYIHSNLPCLQGLGTGVIREFAKFANTENPPPPKDVCYQSILIKSTSDHAF